MIAWFEIPVSDFFRAVKFYSTVFDIKIQIVSLLDTQYGIFDRNNQEMNGCIVSSKDYLLGQGPVIYFKVRDMGEVLRRVKESGGNIITSKTLLRRQLANGQMIIAKTLIDDETGYFSLFTDTEGNRLALYSNT